MTTFRSCRLIVNRKLPNDCRHVCEFIDADFFIVELFLLYFWNRFHQQTLIFFLAIMVIWGKR